LGGAPRSSSVSQLASGVPFVFDRASKFNLWKKGASFLILGSLGQGPDCTQSGRAFFAGAPPWVFGRCRASLASPDILVEACPLVAPRLPCDHDSRTQPIVLTECVCPPCVGPEGGEDRARRRNMVQCVHVWTEGWAHAPPERPQG